MNGNSDNFRVMHFFYALHTVMARGDAIRIDKFAVNGTMQVYDGNKCTCWATGSTDLCRADVR